MFALSEVLDAPWARAAVSDQFIVWRGEQPEWKLYLPDPWPVGSWKEPPDNLVIEGTETIRSLIGGEEWRVFTRSTAPLFELIEAFPRLGHWGEDEEIEPLVPFLRAGIERLALDGERFAIGEDGQVHFLPGGLPEIETSQVQALLEKRPKTWKVRPPRGSGWKPSWQLLWLWIEAARILWATHFGNPVATLVETWDGMPYSERGAPPPEGITGPVDPANLGQFIQQCTSENLDAGIHLLRSRGHWTACVVVRHPGNGRVQADEALRRIEQLASQSGLVGLLTADGWTGGWSHRRSVDGSEGWLFEVVSPPLHGTIAQPWVAGLP